jgi:MFS family permease
MPAKEYFYARLCYDYIPLNTLQRLFYKGPSVIITENRCNMNEQDIPHSLNTESKFFYGNIIVAASMFIMLVNWGTYFAFGVFFKPVLTEFGWTRAMTSGAFSLSVILHGVLGVVAGGITDKLGPRIVLVLCAIILGAGYMLMSQIHTLWQLYLFYGVIIGIGMGGAWVPLLSTVARWFVKRRGVMSGFVLIGNSLGALIIPPIANQLLSIYDWRLSYVIMGGLVILLVVSIAQFLKRDPAQIGLIPYGENNVTETVSRTGSDGFSFREAVCTRQFWLVFTMLICFGFTLFAVMVHIVSHVTELGISPAYAASVLATVGGVSIAGRVVLGSLDDRIGSRQVFIIGFILMTMAFFWIMFARELWMLYLFAVVFGFAHGGIGASESPLVARLFGISSHGLILGVAALGFMLGAAIGPFITGYIFDLTESYRIAFLVCGSVSILGCLLSVILPPIKDQHSI